MKHLIITTKYGNKFRVNELGFITQYENKEFSYNWILESIHSVKSNYSIPFSNLNETRIKELLPLLLYKNGNPKYTVMDIDYGTTRLWGNTTVHGILSLHYENI